MTSISARHRTVTTLTFLTARRRACREPCRARNGGGGGPSTAAVATEAGDEAEGFFAAAVPDASRRSDIGDDEPPASPVAIDGTLGVREFSRGISRCGGGRPAPPGDAVEGDEPKGLAEV